MLYLKLQITVIKMKASKQYFPVIFVVMLYEVALAKGQSIAYIWGSSSFFLHFFFTLLDLNFVMIMSSYLIVSRYLFKVEFVKVCCKRFFKMN